MPSLIYHGQSCVEIHAQQANIIVDPWLDENPMADIRADDVQCDVILVTHGHSDHVGDAVKIAQRTAATVVSTYEMTFYLERKGLTVHGMHVGGAHQFPWGRVKLTPAAHGGLVDIEECTHTTVPCGFTVTVDGQTIYHAGDTGLMSDMALIGRLNDVAVAVLPIGDNFTMGPEDAIEAVKMLSPRVVVPMHYDTYDLIKQDVEQFARNVEESTDSACTILRPGEQLDV